MLNFDIGHCYTDLGIDIEKDGLHREIYSAYELIGARFVDEAVEQDLLADKPKEFLTVIKSNLKQALPESKSDTAWDGRPECRTKVPELYY